MDPYKKQFVLGLLGYAVQRDVRAEDLCRLAGLELKGLKGNSMPDITEKHLLDLWYNAIELTGDRLFGLHLGESLQLSALGVVGQMIQTSPTIGEALAHGARLVRLITNLATMTVERKRKRVVVCFYPRKNISGAWALSAKQFIDFFMVFTLHEVDGLVLQKIHPVRITSESAIPEYCDEFERIFRCDHVVEKREYSMEFHGDLWDEPIISANYELQRSLLQMEQALPLKRKPLMRDRVLAYIQWNAYLGTPTIEEVAANLNSSPRTLQRKLREEGITFQGLTDEVRKSLALRYLTDDHPMKEIASMLGYNELSAFIRAFRRWTGTTPSAYRDSSTQQKSVQR